MGITKLKLAVFVLLLVLACVCMLYNGYLRSHTRITQNTATISSEGKTKVYRYNGKVFERLHEFCTWTQPLDCTMLTTNTGFIPIFIHFAQKDPYMSALLVKNGNRDEFEISVVIGELKKHPEAMFVDVGANLGIYTLTIAKDLKRSVLAVEPVMENAVRLCKSIQENKMTESVTVVFNPLSDTKVKVNMNKPDHHLSASKVFVVGKSDPKANGLSCPSTPPLDTTRLDDLLQFMTSKTAVLKIDVESYEYHVINGGKQFLTEIYVPAIYMEWTHVMKTANAKTLVDIMKQGNYVPHIPKPNHSHEVLSYESYKTWPIDVIWLKQ